MRLYSLSLHTDVAAACSRFEHEYAYKSGHLSQLLLVTGTYRNTTLRRGDPTSDWTIYARRVDIIAVAAEHAQC